MGPALIYLAGIFQRNPRLARMCNRPLLTNLEILVALLCSSSLDACSAIHRSTLVRFCATLSPAFASAGEKELSENDASESVSMVQDDCFNAALLIQVVYRTYIHHKYNSTFNNKIPISYKKCPFLDVFIILLLYYYI